MHLSRPGAPCSRVTHDSCTHSVIYPTHLSWELGYSQTQSLPQVPHSPEDRQMRRFLLSSRVEVLTRVQVPWDPRRGSEPGEQGTGC